MVCPHVGRHGNTGGESHAAHFADVGGGGFLILDRGRMEESCLLILDFRFDELRIGIRKMSSSVKECHRSSLDM